MNTVTLQVPREEAAKMLPFFESKRQQLLAELKVVDAQIAAIRGASQQSASTSLAKNNGGRSKKDESRKRIEEYLNSSEAHFGANISQVARESGTSYTSTWRILDEMQKAGKAEVKNELWHLTS